MGPKFVCPETVIVPCKSECRYDCYRQRDLETQGISSQCGHASVWRRQQRQLWGLEFAPSSYKTGDSYAQPQREDWPVYDPALGAYVEYSSATAHLESMLQLDYESAKELRCVKIFKTIRHERGKSGKSPSFNI